VNFFAIAVVGAISLVACSSSVSSVVGETATAPTGTPGLLPRNVVVPLKIVARYFPEITVVVRSGNDETATGSPLATRSVAFANAAGTKKVTISVDSFGSASMRRPPTALRLPRVRPSRVSQGSETHVGLGVLVGNLTVGATLAGFEASSANVGSLVSLARAEVAVAKALSN
jgi:hypothetical protein